jgi:hypothetical protein
VISLLRSHWKIAGTAVALGLAGSCATAVALTGAPARGPGPRLPLPAGAAATASARQGRRLMEHAAAACAALSYRGTQLVLWHERPELTRSLLQVWHRPGRPDLVRSQAAAGDQAARPAGLDSALAADGALWLSPQLLALMRTRYQLIYTGTGSADGRPARVVEARARGGPVAARFWLDDATGLPLRRQVFARRQDLISDSSFVSLQIGHRALTAMPGPGGQPWADQLSRRELAGLRAAGWPLPRTLGGLTLFAASSTGAGRGQVIGLSYSDGLSVISVFVQRGELPARLPGWRQATAGGRAVLTADPDRRGMAWSARGFVYTLIADAPEATVTRAVAGLPPGGRSGFWARMARGARRLISWADPFR